MYQKLNRSVQGKEKKRKNNSEKGGKKNWMNVELENMELLW
jgi:hypothetical protein